MFGSFLVRHLMYSAMRGSRRRYPQSRSKAVYEPIVSRSTSGKTVITEVKTRGGGVYKVYRARNNQPTMLLSTHPYTNANQLDVYDGPVLEAFIDAQASV